MPDASPTKWHRAHTTWFFEQFLLRAASRRLSRRSTSASPILFNSYYVAAGPRHARPQRGLITRPDGAGGRGLSRPCRCGGRAAARDRRRRRSSPRCCRIVEIGLNHEQQHQELMLTDILHAFAQNPIAPAYDAGMAAAARRKRPTAGFVDAAGRHPHHRPSTAAASASTTRAGASGAAAAGAHRARLVTNARVARIHGRRRLRDAVAVAVRRLGDGRGGRLERAGLLARDRRRVAFA